MFQFKTPDLRTIAPLGSGGILPISGPDGYLVKITNVEKKLNKDGINSRLEFSLEVISGEFIGSTGHHGVNLFHNDPGTLNLALSNLSTICHVTGKFPTSSTTNSDFWNNIPFKVVVTKQFVAAGKPDQGFTQISKWMDKDGIAPGASATPAPAQAKPKFPGKPAPATPAPAKAPEPIEDPASDDDGENWFDS